MKVLLYSGGMDSWLIDKLWKPDKKIYINIGGSYSKTEMKYLPQDVEIIDFPLGQYEQPSKFVPLRNLYFLMLASNYGDEICLGATAGDWGSKDKCPEFFDKAEEMLNFLWGKQSKVAVGRKIRIERKYLFMHKNELVEEYLKNGGNIKAVKEETFSCFTPQDGKECLACKPCFRKYCVLAYYGYIFTKEERERMYKYVKEWIVPVSKNENATYYSERGKEGEIDKEIVRRLYKEFGGNYEQDKRN